MLIIGGEFNLDPDRDKQAFKILSDLFFSFNCQNLVTSPTGADNILDQLFCNYKNTASV